MHQFIIKRLCESGCKAYVAGGSVRDLLLGVRPHDYDVVTEASPAQVQEVFLDQKVSIVGKSFQVCLVNGIEVAGYRRVNCFGLSDKNFTVEPAETIEEELGRRDLTINAMALGPYTGELIDPFGGGNDLKNKTIRFVGNPTERIYEDPCRIIRACRFLARIGGSFDPETDDALRRNAHLVRDFVAPERIRSEVLKSMQTQRTSWFFIALQKIGSLQDLFPSLVQCQIDGGPHHDESVFEHNMFVGDAISVHCPLTKLAGYLHDIGKALTRNEQGGFIGHEKIGAELARQELHALRFSGKEVERVTNLIRLHMQTLNGKRKEGIRRMLSRLREKEVPYREWLRLKLADRTGNLAKGSYAAALKKDLLQKLEAELVPETNAFSPKELAVSGHDIMETLKIAQGPEVRHASQFLFESVLGCPELNTRKRLIQLMKHWRMLSAIGII